MTVFSFISFSNAVFRLLREKLLREADRIPI